MEKNYIAAMLKIIEQHILKQPNIEKEEYLANLFLLPLLFF